jgi:hypothetical protein
MSKNIEGGDKVVQTEVPTSLHERFVAAADARGMTIKEAVREAIAEFTYRNEPVDRDDPIFEPLSRATDTESADDVASEQVDDLLYGER